MICKGKKAGVVFNILFRQFVQQIVSCWKIPIVEYSQPSSEQQNKGDQVQYDQAIAQDLPGVVESP